MIDFRYHLVSIVAIFLALSVGIVLGTTLLEEPAIKTAETLADQLSKGNTELRDQLDVLRKREAGNDAFAAARTPELVRGGLAGQSVVIVEAPGATAAVRDAVQQTISDAGATVTGRVTLTEKYVDAEQSGFIDRLALAVKPASVVFPAEDTPYDKAAAVLASAIVTADPTQTGKENPEAGGILDAFERAGLLSVTGTAATPAADGREASAAPEGRLFLAGAAVLIAPAEPYAGESAAAQADALAATALGLDEGSRGSVLTGTAAATAAGGALAALRENTVAAEKVSSVDTADMSAGRVVVVYALREQLAGGVGQYGIGTGASAFEPTAPTPAPSASPPPTADSGG
ncbi:copper transporter [Planomonospora sp. ID91781]|uniref:copper transporter n=1 Tax=Planomonospora sp. ID91781 TaxID=2738135 RepID=UPI0018C3FAB2|nr:copper transporter [Planomonospora sp. ID91781]MBG0823970.1 copper transporter [Planomonospora sp. ID91781]